MNQGGTTEIIWHFMGYLHLTQDLATAHPSLDGWARHGVATDYKAVFAPAGTVVPDLDGNPSTSSRTSFSEMPGRLAGAEHLPALHLADVSVTARSMPVFDQDHSDWVSRPVQPVWPGEDPVHPGPSAPPPYAMTYGDGGDDKLISATQTNVADDSDSLVTSSGAGASPLHTIDIPETLHEMLATARALTPEDLVPSDQSASGWLDLVARRDAARDGGTHDAHAENQVEPGR
jgi:hypothetical protein